MTLPLLDLSGYTQINASISSYYYNSRTYYRIDFGTTFNAGDIFIIEFIPINILPIKFADIQLTGDYEYSPDGTFLGKLKYYKVKIPINVGRSTHNNLYYNFLPSSNNTSDPYYNLWNVLNNANGTFKIWKKN